MSIQPKPSGKWKGWVNVEVLGDHRPSSIDWDSEQWWKHIENVQNVLVLDVFNGVTQEIVDAKVKELNNLKENNVYGSVDDVGQKTISSKWVITENFSSDGTRRVKGRLVV